MEKKQKLVKAPWNIGTQEPFVYQNPISYEADIAEIQNILFADRKFKDYTPEDWADILQDKLPLSYNAEQVWNLIRKSARSNAIQDEYGENFMAFLWAKLNVVQQQKFWKFLTWVEQAKALANSDYPLENLWNILDSKQRVIAFISAPFFFQNPSDSKQNRSFEIWALLSNSEKKSAKKLVEQYATTQDIEGPLEGRDELSQTMRMNLFPVYLKLSEIGEMN